MNTIYQRYNQGVGQVAAKIYALGVMMIGLVLWSPPGIVLALAAGQDIFEMEADGSYTMREGDTKVLSENLAVFQAKRAAVEAAEKYFSRRERITFFGKKREEIINYTVDQAASNVLQEKWTTTGSSATYQVKLKVSVQPSDFIEAEIESLRQEQKDSKESLRKEMEPAISVDSPPGQDIAVAYHRIRIGALRLAIIYLDRLQLKYPNWSEIYEVKALAYDLHHEPLNMKAALQKACELGSPHGCAELEMLAPKSDR